MPRTPRFSRETLTFIQRASKQRRPDWLDRNRSEYEKSVLEPLKHLALVLKAELAAAAPGYHFPQQGLGRLKRSSYGVEKYGALFRDYVSYSAARPRKSRFEHNPNLFFLIDPDDPDGDRVLLAGGLYMPSSKQLRALREAVATTPEPFEQLFASKPFASRFPGGFSDEKISSRVPRGFDPSHPRLEWIRLQAFFVWRPYTLREFTSATFAELVARDCAQILRLNDLLEKALAGRLHDMIERKEEPTPRGLSTRLEGIQAPAREMDF